jgi:CBS domain containing-hemolysin-like protein
MGLYENMRCEPVSRLALREPVVVGPKAKVRDAVQYMRQRKLGCAIVVDEHSRPVGLFAESKLTQLLSERPSAVDDPILQHLDTQWPTVSLSDPISCVLAALEFANIRFLIVVDDKGQLAGLTGQKGLMEYVAEHFPRQVVVQRIGGKPYPVDREGA